MKKTPHNTKTKLLAFLSGVLVVTGISSVFATLPPNPDGFSSPGGWLGQFFDFENSKNWNLVLRGDIHTSGQVCDDTGCIGAGSTSVSETNIFETYTSSEIALLECNASLQWKTVYNSEDAQFNVCDGVTWLTLVWDTSTQTSIFNSYTTAEIQNLECNDSNSGWIVYDSDLSETQVCDGTNWSSLEGVFTSGTIDTLTCESSDVGKLVFDQSTGQTKVCDGTDWVVLTEQTAWNVALSLLTTAEITQLPCTSSEAGTLVFDTDEGVTKICDGTQWSGVQAAPNYTKKFSTAETWTAVSGLTEPTTYEIEIDTRNLTAGSLDLQVDGASEQVFTQSDGLVTIQVEAESEIKVVSEGEEIGYDVSSSLFNKQYVVSVEEEQYLQGYPSYTVNRTLNSVRDITFSNDGMKMFVLGKFLTQSYQLSEHNLNLPFDLSTKTFVSSTGADGGQSVDFSNDGRKMFLCYGDDTDIQEYALSNAFDLSSASAQAILPNHHAYCTDLWFSHDGRKLFVLVNWDPSQKLLIYSLSTAFSLSSASLESEFDVENLLTNSNVAIGGFDFNSDGSKLFLYHQYPFGSDENDGIYEYDLISWYDFSTAVYSTRFLSGGPTFRFHQDGKKIFSAGNYGKIDEYIISWNSQLIGSATLSLKKIIKEDNNSNLVKLASLDSATRDACDAENVGAMYYDTTDNQPYFCIYDSEYKWESAVQSIPVCSDWEDLKYNGTDWECTSVTWTNPELHYFTTTEIYTGNLGGKDGANAICNSDDKHIPSKTYHAVFNEHWGTWGASYFGEYGDGEQGVDTYSLYDYFPMVWMDDSSKNCLNWTSEESKDEGRVSTELTSGTLIGFFRFNTHTDYNGRSCAIKYPLLCVEDL